MVDDGANCTRAGAVAKEPGVCSGGAGYRSFDTADHFQTHRAEHTRPGNCLRHTDDTDSDAIGGLSFFSRVWCSATAGLLGKPRRRRQSKHSDLSVATSLPGVDDGVDSLFAELCGRWIARRFRSANEKVVLRSQISDLRFQI